MTTRTEIEWQLIVIEIGLYEAFLLKDQFTCLRSCNIITEVVSPERVERGEDSGLQKEVRWALRRRPEHACQVDISMCSPYLLSRLTEVFHGREYLGLSYTNHCARASSYNHSPSFSAHSSVLIQRHEGSRLRDKSCRGT